MDSNKDNALGFLLIKLAQKAFGAKVSVSSEKLISIFGLSQGAKQTAEYISKVYDEKLKHLELSEILDSASVTTAPAAEKQPENKATAKATETPQEEDEDLEGFF